MNLLEAIRRKKNKMPTKTLQKEKHKVPKLRFAGFEGGWEEKKLGGVAEITSSKRVYSSDYVKTGIPFFRGKEISELKRSKTASDLLYIKESKYLEFKNKFGVPQKDDILITSVGTLGNIYRVNLGYDFYFKDGNLIWIKNPTMNSSFLEILLDFHKKELLKGVIGSTQKALTIDGIKKMNILFPTLPEQQKIAGFLGGVDEWIENLRAQKESFESYKKAMMQKIFSQEIRFKDDKGNGFPEWGEKKLGEVFYSEKGDGIPKDAVVVDGTNECILYGELYTKYKEVIFNICSKTDSSDGLKSQVGDLLIPCSTTTTGIDLANVTALNKEGVLLGGDITVLRSKDTINNIFYAYYLSNYKKREIAKYAQGSTIVHLYYNHFKKIIIDIPTYAEQQKIADFLTSVDKVLESKQQQITQAEQWKKGLMQGLFV